MILCPAYPTIAERYQEKVQEVIESSHESHRHITTCPHKLKKAKRLKELTDSEEVARDVV
jgi:hypothetical protein